MDQSEQWQTAARRLGLGAALLWVLSLAYTALPVITFGASQLPLGGLLTEGLHLLNARPPLSSYPWVERTLAFLPLPAACLISLFLWRATFQTYRTMAWWLTALSALVALVLFTGFAIYVSLVHGPHGDLATKGSSLFGLIQIRIACVCLVPLTLIPWPRFAFYLCAALAFPSIIEVHILYQPGPVVIAAEAHTEAHSRRLAAATNAALAAGFDEPMSSRNAGGENRKSHVAWFSFDFAYFALTVFAYKWARKKSRHEAGRSS